MLHTYVILCPRMAARVCDFSHILGGCCSKCQEFRTSCCSDFSSVGLLTHRLGPDVYRWDHGTSVFSALENGGKYPILFVGIQPSQLGMCRNVQDFETIHKIYPKYVSGFSYFGVLVVSHQDYLTHFLILTMQIDRIQSNQISPSEIS